MLSVLLDKSASDNPGNDRSVRNENVRKRSKKDLSGKPVVNGAELNSNEAVGEDQGEGMVELMMKAAEGDRKAFGAIFKLKRPKYFRLAARICGTDEADDVVQIAFLRLWKRMPIFKTPEHIDAWLARTTVNRAIDVLRHIGRRIKLVVTEKKVGLDVVLNEPMQRGDCTRVFDRVAECLGERQKTAFVLREMEGYSTGEVADLMGIKQSTVRNLVLQARIGLRQSLRMLFPEYCPVGKEENEAEKNE